MVVPIPYFYLPTSIIGKVLPWHIEGKRASTYVQSDLRFSLIVSSRSSRSKCTFLTQYTFISSTMFFFHVHSTITLFNYILPLILTQSLPVYPSVLPFIWNYDASLVDLLISGEVKMKTRNFYQHLHCTFGSGHQCTGLYSLILMKLSDETCEGINRKFHSVHHQFVHPIEKSSSLDGGPQI